MSWGGRRLCNAGKQFDQSSSNRDYFWSVPRSFGRVFVGATTAYHINSERATEVDKLVKHAAPQYDEVESIEFPLIVDSLMWVNCCAVTTVLSMCPWNAIHHANGVRKCLIRLQSDVNKCFAVLN